MNWGNQIEKRKVLIVGGVIIIAFSALVVTSLRSPVAYDSYWHLQMGKDWLENGLSPWVDHYSFTYNGQAITNPPVIFQGLLHLVVSQFGMRTGFLVVRFVGFLLTLGSVLLLLRQMKAPAIFYAIVLPIIVALLQMRAIVRPELFSYTLSVIALMLYFKAGNRISPRYLVPMVALMWIWSFYHSSVIGYVIFFGFFLDCAISQYQSRAPQLDWLKWFMWGGGIVAVGFLNPSFTHPLIQAITFPSEWKTIILEYQWSGQNLKSFIIIYVLMVFAILMPILALLQRRFGILVIWAVLGYSAIMMQRMVTPSGIVIVMMTVYLLIDGRYLERLSLAGNEFLGKFVWFVLLLSIGVTLYSTVERARHFLKENLALLGRYPIAMTDYMTERQISGRIFNHYGLGGYLIYRLAPNNQVYIDGRTQILYPVEHAKRYEGIIRASDPRILRAELDKYSIDQIILEYSAHQHNKVQEVGDFGLDFMDAQFVLYTRGSSNFPTLGKLLSHPECWRSDMLGELNSERQKMDKILPGKSALYPFANLVVGYSNADDGKTFFDENIDGDFWTDEMRRFAGYRFLETGENWLVVNLLGGVEFRKPTDFLASALAMLEAGNIDLASIIIEDFSNVDWQELKPAEILIQYKLYQLLGKYRDLTSVEQQKAESSELKLFELGYSQLKLEQHTLNFSSFCLASKPD